MQSAVHEYQTGEPLPPIEIETLEPLSVIGHSYPRPDVVAKVTGAAKFADDYIFPGMLYGATLRAEYPTPAFCPSTPARRRHCPAYTPC